MSITASKSVVARGETLTVSGVSLGETGSLSLGGVPVIPDSWTSTEIKLVVPADAPGGPRTLLVSAKAGSETLDLFVGVNLADGTLEDLAALDLPKGTAVLLGEGDYASTSARLELDNLSLYGQVSSKTTLRTPAGNLHPLFLYADFGFDLVLQYLTLQADRIVILPAPQDALGTLSNSGALDVPTTRSPGLAEFALTLPTPEGGGFSVR